MAETTEYLNEPASDHALKKRMGVSKLQVVWLHVLDHCDAPHATDVSRTLVATMLAVAPMDAFNSDTLLFLIINQRVSMRDAQCAPAHQPFDLLAVIAVGKQKCHSRSFRILHFWLYHEAGSRKLVML